jgi:hypothetical protein
MKLHQRLYADGTHYAWLAWCPACQGPHTFDRRWAFNGKMDKPTFRPSMLAHAIAQWDKKERKIVTRDVHCHSYLTDGVWEYLKDCQHKMAEMKVELPDFPPEEAEIWL